MDFAANTLGHPISVTNPVDGPWVCLYRNSANGTIMQPYGTVVPVNVNGNPVDEAAPLAAIAQPAFNILMQYMVDDVVAAQMGHGRITGAVNALRGPAMSNFGRTPARVITNAPINYTTKEGMIEYREGTKPSTKNPSSAWIFLVWAFRRSLARWDIEPESPVGPSSTLLSIPPQVRPETC